MGYQYINKKKLIKRITEVRDELPVESLCGRYMRGGIRKALKCISEAGVVDVVPVDAVVALRNELALTNEITECGILIIDKLIREHSPKYKNWALQSKDVEVS